MDKSEILSQYLPGGAAPIIARWIDFFQCEFKISKSRSSKLGDYRHPYLGEGHRISVNNNLNPYAFLVTTVHEFAHLLTWNDHQNRVKPHGIEWKRNFRRMMAPFMEQHLLPDDIKLAISNYLANPSAASCSDLNLSRALKNYNILTSTYRLEELPANTRFTIHDGRHFIKGERLRKRYRCICTDNGNVYLFSPLAEVVPLVAGT